MQFLSYTRLIAVICVLGPVSGCVSIGYEFTHYESVQRSEYRLDRMTFSQHGSLGAGPQLCPIEIYSKFREHDGKLAACGHLVESCDGFASGELTEKWFAAAQLILDGEEISRAGFFSLNNVGPGKGKATCVVTDKPWKAVYAGQQPRFYGQAVSVAY